MLQQLEANEAAHGGRLSGRIGQKPHLLYPWMDQLVRHSAILDAVEAVLGPNLFCWASQFFAKNARDPGYVSWHQDGTYWGLSSPDVMTAWVALTPSVPQNGCMRVIPGTHHAGVREHGTSDAAGNLLSINQEVPVTSDEEARASDIVLAAGEISLHDGALIHGSLPNRSPRRRCGLTLRYVPASVKPVGINSMGKNWNAVLVRGEDRHAHFGRRERPFAG